MKSAIPIEKAMHPILPTDAEKHKAQACAILTKQPKAGVWRRYTRGIGTFRLVKATPSLGIYHKINHGYSSNASEVRKERR